MYVQGLFLFSGENDGNGPSRLHSARYRSGTPPRHHFMLCVQIPYF